MDVKILSDKVKTKDIRAEYELEITKKALNRNMPVFGICNVLQLINIPLEGTLTTYSDHLSSELNHEQPPPKIFQLTLFIIKEGTILRSLESQFRLW